ncbi:MAG: sugar transporter [Alcaligenaceae bacterium]|nr:sugar transporter [Alcaligenaceae bacterium]
MGGLGMVLALSGCGAVLSGSGPYMGTITAVENSNTPAYKLVNLTAETITPYARRPQPAAVSHVSPVASTMAIRLVPGDVIKVMISDSAEGGVFAPLAAGGTVFNNVRVAPNGAIKLPYVGSLNVKGLTLTEVDDAISKKLKGAAATDPQAHTEITGDLSGSVLVAGAVKAPGRFSSLNGPLTILDVVNMAGGPIAEPHLVNVVVRNGKQAYTINYNDVLLGKNQAVAPRSEVILERDRQRFVAMGAIREPGLKDFPSAKPSLLEVLGSVGGLDESKADPQGVFVFRLNPAAAENEPQAEVFRLDMRMPESIFLARVFQVMPEDAVYVTNAPVYEWQKIISPIVQTLVLGRTVGGF